MSLPPWPRGDSAFLGTLGNLVAIPGFGVTGGDLSESADDSYSFATTTTGAVVAQYVATAPARRTWDVSLQDVTHAELAGLVALADGGFGYGPFCWVTPAMQVSNLVSRDDANGRFVPAGWYSGGAQVMPDGAVVSGSLMLLGSTPTSPPIITGTIPLPPDRSSITVSAYVQGVGARVIGAWVNEAGSVIASSPGSAAISTGLERSVMVGAPPSAAVGVKVAVTTAAVQVAGPCVTWTNGVRPYGPGAGCAKAVPIGLKRSLKLITDDGTWQEASFQVREVG